MHFKNAFRGADQNLATIDGVWQISDTPTEVKVDTEYDKMSIRTVDAADTITMDNKDNAITLSKNKDTALMAGINIKTADQDEITAENPLRFYIYKEITEPGDIRQLEAQSATWSMERHLPGIPRHSSDSTTTLTIISATRTSR